MLIYIYRIDGKYISNRKLTNIITQHIPLYGESHVHVILQGYIGTPYIPINEIIRFFRPRDCIVNMIFIHSKTGHTIHVYENTLYNNDLDTSILLECYTMEVTIQFNSIFCRTWNE